MSTLASIVLSHGDSNDGTHLPYWIIARKAGLGKIELVQGIWFNREEATKHLESRRHAYGETAFVYCASGYHSLHMAELYSMANAINKETTE